MQIIEELTQTILSDTMLDESTKSTLLDLAGEVSQDPTPENVKALVLTLKTLSKTERYLTALETLTNLSAD